METRENNDTINFVARHWRKGAFDTRKGWSKVWPRAKRPFFGHRLKIAASVAAIAVAGATAAIIYHHYQNPEVERVVGPTTTGVAVDNTLTVRIIDFEKASLTIVVKQIEEVYGVKVTNVPDNADDLSLTLRYEGNAIDLVDTINEILDIEMEVEK